MNLFVYDYIEKESGRVAFWVDILAENEKDAKKIARKKAMARLFYPLGFLIGESPKNYKLKLKEKRQI